MKTFDDENDEPKTKEQDYENTFVEVAKAIGYTKQTAIREQKKALAKARRILKSKGFTADYFFKD